MSQKIYNWSTASKRQDACNQSWSVKNLEGSRFASEQNLSFRYIFTYCGKLRLIKYNFSTQVEEVYFSDGALTSHKGPVAKNLRFVLLWFDTNTIEKDIAACIQSWAQSFTAACTQSWTQSLQLHVSSHELSYLKKTACTQSWVHQNCMYPAINWIKTACIQSWVIETACIQSWVHWKCMYPVMSRHNNMQPDRN